MKKAVVLFAIIILGNFSVLGQNCISVNLADTLKACINSSPQLNPSLTLGNNIPLDTTWSPAAGLSNPNIINPIVTIINSTLYKLTILSESLTNLVVNGNFSAGNSNFTSNYVIGSGGTWGPCSSAGTYLITTNPTNAHSLWSSFGDHTSGSGQMMVINGAQTLNTNLWCQTINVTPNTTYNFTTWVASNEPTSPAVLQFAINGLPLGGMFNAPPTPGQWNKFNAVWFSGSSTSAAICITNQNNAAIGNDFSLDDISFKQVCTSVDSVYIKAIDTSIRYDTLTACEGTPILFGAQQIQSSGTYSHTFTNILGCDSLMILTVNLLDTNQRKSSIAICAGGTVNFAGQVISTSGVYSHTFQNVLGCDSLVILTVNALPPITTSQSISICQDSTLIFNGQTITTSGTYTGTFKNANGCDSIVTLNVNVIPPQTRTINVRSCNDTSFTYGGKIIDTSGTYIFVFKNIVGCDSTIELNLIDGEPAFVDFSFTPTIAQINVPTQFINMSINCITYIWEFGDSTTTSDENPIHQYARDGHYLVCLTGWTAQGCSTKVCKRVDARVFHVIDVPTAFSPNNDGNNDILYVKGAGVKEFTFRIYNRWGQMIFESKDLNKGWDGKYQGNPQEMETFGYMLKATFLNNEVFEKQGNITLFK